MCARGINNQAQDNIESIYLVDVNVWMHVSWKLNLLCQHETNVSCRKRNMSNQLTKQGSNIRAVGSQTLKKQL